MVKRDNTLGKSAFAVFQAFYLIFGIPLLLFFACGFLWIGLDDNYAGYYYLSALAWTALIIYP